MTKNIYLDENTNVLLRQSGVTHLKFVKEYLTAELR